MTLQQLDTALAAFSKFDLTIRQARALLILALENQMPTKKVKEHTGASSAATTNLIDGLEAHGLTERLPNPEDRRSPLIRLTAKGQNFAANLYADQIPTAVNQ